MNEDLGSVRLAEPGEGADYVVAVVCNDQSHAGREVKITWFGWTELGGIYGDGPPEWSVEVGRRRHHARFNRELAAEIAAEKARHPERNHFAAAHGKAHQTLRERFAAHPQPKTREVIRSADGSVMHTKYRLRCSLCGLDVQRRDDAVHAVLDKLRLAGVSRIELSHLAATLS